VGAQRACAFQQEIGRDRFGRGDRIGIGGEEGGTEMFKIFGVHGGRADTKNDIGSAEKLIGLNLV
jgi:hypothetical protein